LLTLGFLAAVTFGASLLPGAFPYLAWAGTGLGAALAVAHALWEKSWRKPLGKERQATPEQDEALLGALNRIVIAANISMPRVVVVELAGGRSNAWMRLTTDGPTIFVTQSLVANCTPTELEAVLAHEVAHIVNNDVLLRRIIAACLFLPGGVLRLFKDLFRPSSERFVEDMTARLAVVLAIVLWYPLLLSIVFYFVSFQLMMRLSRQRELAADHFAAVLMGDPAPLASALLKLAGKRAPRLDLRLSAVRAAEMILPNYAEDGWESLDKAFLRTHPSVKHRLLELGVSVDPSRPRSAP
jgi:heat shock protein HtpX